MYFYQPTFFLSSVHFAHINLLSSSNTSSDVYSANDFSKSSIFPENEINESIVSLVHICGQQLLNSSCSSSGFSALLVSEYFLGSKQSSHSSGIGTEMSTNGSTSCSGYNKTIRILYTVNINILIK